MDIHIFEQRVSEWILTCFSEEISKDKTERCFRFIEESLELAQSLGMTKEQVIQLVDYTFNRPLGEPNQEVGGVMVTLAALTSACDLNLQYSAIVELMRINSKIDKIRAKHFNKPKDVLSPIPGNTI